MAGTGLVDPLLVEAAAIARGLDRTDLADSAEALRAQLVAAEERTEVTVVVVGETGRGKSSLVNALLGRPGLSPVSPAVDTGVPVAFGWAEQESAWAVVADDGRPRRIPIPMDKVASLVRVGGDQGPAGAVDEAIERAWVDVGLPDEWLRGKRVVDTPGVGGLTPSHGRLAAMALTDADLVLCVADASAPMSRPEAEFVAAAARDGGRALVVFTKKDAFPAWREVMAADAEAVAALGVAVPFHAASSTLAEKAVSSGMSEELREIALRSSGIEEVRAAIDRFATAGPQILREVSVAAVTCHVVDELARNCALRVQALSSPPAEVAALAAEVKQQQEALGERTRAAVRKSGSRTLNRTRLVRHDFDERARLLRSEFRVRALEGPREELDTLPDLLRAALTGAAAEAFAAFPDAIHAMAEEIEQMLPGDVPTEQLSELAALTTDLGSPGVVMNTSKAAGAMTLIGGTTMGMALGTQVLGLLIFPWLGAAITVSAGLGLAFHRLRQQSEQGRRSSVAAWVDRSVADVLAEFARTCDRRQVELAELVENTIEQVFAARAAALEQIRRQLAEITAADQRERPALLSAARELHSRVEKLQPAVTAVSTMHWGGGGEAA